MKRSARALALLSIALAACQKPSPGTGAAGSACTSNGDCQNGLVCLDSKCASVGGSGSPSCGAGSTRCSGNDVEACLPGGNGYEYKETCSTRCSKGGCLAPLCTPSTTRCGLESKTLEACLPDSTGYVVVQSCDLGCQNGVCNTAGSVICTAGEKRCSGDAIELCAAGGTAWAFVQFCPAGCDSSAKACKAPACLPFSERCSSSGAREICDSTGAGYTPAPCSGAEACVAGKCLPTVCTTGQARCIDAATVGVCNASGTGFSPTPCAGNQVCSSGSCQAVVCSPFSSRCKDASTAQVCSGSGTGYLDVACGAGAACMGGTCVQNGATSCTPGSTRCADPLTVATCAQSGTGYAYQTCGANQICAGGACVTIICTPGSSRCASTATAEVCDPSGTKYVTTGCTGVDGGAGYACDPLQGSCQPVICSSGATQCQDPSTLGTCNVAGTGYTPSACGAGTICTGAACRAVICSPNTASCTSPTVAAVCNGTGTATTSTDCSQTGRVCLNGACQVPVDGGGSIICVPGAFSCDGADVRQCNPPGTGYTYVQSCIASCKNGQCVGPACTPFSLSVSTSQVPADNSSTVLVSSGVIQDSDGVAVPDGTLFTVSASNNSGGVLSTDLDTTTPGIQIASLNGKIDFAVRSGPGANAGQTVNVNAAAPIASACAGSTSFSLVTPGTSGFFAEDFTATTRKDGANDTATWLPQLGQATAALGGGLGAAEDQDLYVRGGDTFNLHSQSNPANPSRTFPDAVSLKVASFSPPDGVTLTALPAGFAPGDEVILINLQGDPTNYGNVGKYELFTVKAVEFATNRVTFSAPITKVYGATVDNSNLTGQHITLQRIPHYGNVSIAGTLTANGWNRLSGLGGLLFFKASGTVVVSGSLTMEGAGYNRSSAMSTKGAGLGGPASWGGGRGENCGCSSYGAGGGGHGSAGSPGTVGCGGGSGEAYGDPALSTIMLGASGGVDRCATPPGSGGGAIAVWAATIGVTGSVNANGMQAIGSGSGAGGSVYLRAAQVNIGQNLVSASGGSAGGVGGAGAPGRIFIDARTVHAGDTTTPAYTAGSLAATAKVQLVTLDGTSNPITKARIVTSLEDKRGGSIQYELSSNGGSNWTIFTPGDPLQSLSSPGSDLRLRVTLTGDGSNRPLGVQGVAIEYLAP